MQSVPFQAPLFNRVPKVRGVSRQVACSVFSCTRSLKFGLIIQVFGKIHLERLCPPGQEWNMYPVRGLPLDSTDTGTSTGGADTGTSTGVQVQAVRNRYKYWKYRYRDKYWRYGYRYKYWRYRYRYKYWRYGYRDKYWQFGYSRRLMTDSICQYIPMQYDSKLIQLITTHSCNQYMYNCTLYNRVECGIFF